MSLRLLAYRVFVHPDVERFLRTTVGVEDGALATARATAHQVGLPIITPEAGRAIEVLLRLVGARRVLEIGTGIGYSTLWIIRGLQPGGKVQTIEQDATLASAAKKLFQDAGLADRVEILEGRSMGILPTLPTKAYDAVFIDADQGSLPHYLKESTKLLRHGGLLLADHVFWKGTTWTSTVAIEGTAETRDFLKELLANGELHAAILPLGDGLVVAQRQ